MKKQFATWIEASAEEQSTILVSGGRIGLQIEVEPGALLRAANAQWFKNG
jgi:Cys-tRNA(Pro)/Cys-tRNA(Cys) deacylase